MAPLLRIVPLMLAALELGCDQSAPPSALDIRDATNLDGAPCPDHPSDGCPCEWSPVAEACCLGVGYGLVCTVVFITAEEYEYRWSNFYDCGCISGPPCEGYEAYEHCYMGGP